MIPAEIGELAALIYPDWTALDEKEPIDRDSLREIIAAAHRIHDAGYRKQVPVTNGVRTLEGKS